MSNFDLAPLEGERQLLSERVAKTIARNGIDILGATALDVGGRDGIYVPVLEEVGIGRVVLVDPLKPSVEQAVEQGIVPREDAHAKTLQQYVASEPRPEPADVAFVFNVRPELSVSDAFAESLSEAVKLGGFVLATAIESPTHRNLEVLMESQGNAQQLPVAHARFEVDHGINAHMQLWQMN